MASLMGAMMATLIESFPLADWRSISRGSWNSAARLSIRCLIELHWPVIGSRSRVLCSRRSIRWASVPDGTNRRDEFALVASAVCNPVQSSDEILEHLEFTADVCRRVAAEPLCLALRPPLAGSGSGEQAPVASSRTEVSVGTAETGLATCVREGGF